MRNILIGLALFIFLFSGSGDYAYAFEEPKSTQKLAPLVVPDIPREDNPFGREVFSLKDLREGNLALTERIIATRIDFPLMFDPLGRFARELFTNPERTRFGKDFAVVIRFSSFFWRDDSLTILKNLQAELAAQGLDGGRTDREIRLEFLVFMKNYQRLRDYVMSFPDVSDEARAETGETLDQMFALCKQVLEFKLLTLNGVRTLDELGEHGQADPNGEEEREFARFVAESEGMRPEDIASLLALQNPAQFRRLCLERTAELLADTEDKDVEGLLSRIGPSDAIVLAAYFARDRINAYQNPLDQMSRNPGDDEEQLQVGDCRHFAGLAIHYLNVVVKPINPNLRNWYFGAERADIGDYHHAYVTAVHLRKEEGNEKIDLFFFDPVVLASHAPEKLCASDVTRLIDAASKDDHFFSIKRYGEDFVARKNNKPFPDATPQGQENEEITVDNLLGE